MPLSEHEQRLLDQIERALYAEDPKFASTVSKSDLRNHMRRRLRRAGFVLVAGFGLMLAGVVAQQFVLGVVGFVVMVGALLLALTSWKRMGSGATAAPSGTPRGRVHRPGRSRGASHGSWKHRLEERWKRRWDERGR